MDWKFEKEFREAHPETIGETDKHFDLDNYKDWLEQQLVNKNDLLQRVSQQSELACELLSKISEESMCSVVADEWIVEFFNSQACG